MRKIVLICLMLVLWVSEFALADCVYNGQLYKTGERAGGMTCQSDGTWR